MLYSRLSGDWPGEETSVLLLPCDQEPCVARDYGGRVSLLDLAEMTLSGKSGSAEKETRKVRKVVQTRDQDGNIIYQWYDQDGHLHTISEWEYKRQLSMYFQSWLEFLYPEYFGSSIPAGGGWHQWQYWKVRRTADRPENTGPQQWPDQQDSKDMTCVPNEMVVKILSNLGIRDISVCRSVNRTWKELIDNSHLQARSFCLDCPPPAVLYSPQKAVERYSSSIRDWLTGFSDKGKESVEQLDQLLEVKYFPEELFVSIAKTLAQAKFFLCKNTGAIRHASGVTNVSFSPDGTYLVIVSFDKTATIWRLIDGQWQKKATIQHTDRVNSASFSPDGYHLVTASNDNTAKIWGLVDSQWQEKATIQHTDWVRSASFSPDGYHLVTASCDKTAKIWEFVDGQWQEKATIQHTSQVNNASFSPDGYHLVTISYDTVRIWGLVDGQWQEKTTIQHTNQVTSACFSPNGYYLVTASADHTAKIWRLVDGQWQEHTTIQHNRRINSACFSPDGYHLVTVSDDFTATIQGLVGGKWLKKATIQHTRWVNISPDGYNLVTVSGYDIVKIWVLKSNPYFELSHSRVIGTGLNLLYRMNIDPEFNFID